MKIKANNLMIGDLIEVAFRNGEWKCVRVEQIRYIEDSHIIYFSYKDADGEHHNYISCDGSEIDGYYSSICGYSSSPTFYAEDLIDSKDVKYWRYKE